MQLSAHVDQTPFMKIVNVTVKIIVIVIVIVIVIITF